MFFSTICLVIFVPGLHKLYFCAEIYNDIGFDVKYNDNQLAIRIHGKVNQL